MDNILNLQDEKFKDVTVKGYEFKIRYMSPMDRISILQKRVSLQAGNPISSFTEPDFIYLENIAIVDVCTEEMPKGFKENESSATWTDVELINDLANEIRIHTNDIEGKLKKNRPIIGGN